jgi:hypothetical protein
VELGVRWMTLPCRYKPGEARPSVSMDDTVESCPYSPVLQHAASHYTDRATAAHTLHIMMSLIPFEFSYLSGRPIRCFEKTFPVGTGADTVTCCTTAASSHFSYRMRGGPYPAIPHRAQFIHRLRRSHLAQTLVFTETHCGY